MMIIIQLLEGTARYAGLHLAPAEGFNQCFFLPFENNFLKNLKSQEISINHFLNPRSVRRRKNFS